jgi:hypothetical protein
MLYKYVGHENTDEVIKYLKCFIDDGTIYASQPLSFNDPAEFKVNINFDATKEEIRKKYFLDNPKLTEKDFSHWHKNFDDQAKWYAKYSTREAFLTRFGTICLTRDCDNFLMWSHYARHHTGFCIGFDDSIADSVDDRSVYGDVNYSTSIPSIYYFKEGIEKLAKAFFLNKGASWAYEQEFRIITNYWGMKKFEKSTIKEVVLGCRAPAKLQDQLVHLIGTEIQVNKMALSSDHYALKKIALEKDVYFQGDA